jgi:hypothetical protein
VRIQTAQEGAVIRPETVAGIRTRRARRGRTGSEPHRCKRRLPLRRHLECEACEAGIGSPWPQDDEGPGNDQAEGALQP